MKQKQHGHLIILSRDRFFQRGMVSSFVVLFALLLSVSSLGLQAQSVLLSEDFESVPYGGDKVIDALPDGWSSVNGYEGPNARFRWHVYRQSENPVQQCAACDGPFSDKEDAAQIKEEILLTPELTLGGTYQLSFEWSAPSASPLENKEYDFQIRVIEEGSDPKAVEPIWSFTNPDQLRESGVAVFPWQGWKRYHSEIDLSEYQGKKVRIAFVHKMLKKTANIVYVDNVKVAAFTPITTPRPELDMARYDFGECWIGSTHYSKVIKLKNIGKGKLSLTSVEAPEGVEVVFNGGKDFALVKNTSVELLLRYNTSMTSAIKGDVVLNTNGGAAKIQIAAKKKLLPLKSLYEGFEGETFPPVAWSNDGWRAISGNIEGLRCAYSSGSVEKADILMSPRLDLSEGTHTLYFAYENKYESLTDEPLLPENYMVVELSTDGGKTWKELLRTTNGDTYNVLEKKSISLGAPKSDNCYVRWYVPAISISGGQVPELSMFFLDEVVLPSVYGFGSKPQAPTLVAPKDGADKLYAKALTLSWGKVLFAKGYKLYVGETSNSFEVVKGMDLGDKSSYQLTNLKDNQTYYWYIEAYNEQGSTPSPVRSFTTVADQTVSSYPYSEDFEGESVPPLGWGMSASKGVDWSLISTGSASGEKSILGSSRVAGAETSLETMPFKLPADKTIKVTFQWGVGAPVTLKRDPTFSKKNNSTGYNGIEGAFFEVLVDGEWHELAIMSDSGNEYWVRQSFSLEAYKGKTVSFRWRYKADDLMKSRGVSLDNISVYYAEDQYALFNEKKWNFIPINWNGTDSSKDYLAFTNDGLNPLEIKEVSFGTSNFSTDIKVCTKIEVGEALPFTVVARGEGGSGEVTDQLKITFASGYVATLPLSVTVLPKTTRYYSFENDEYGSLQPNEFLTIDVDKLPTFSFSGIRFLNYTTPFAFMVLNPKTADWRNVYPPTGDQVLMALGAATPHMQTEDWIVSGAMKATKQSQFVFKARNYEGTFLPQWGAGVVSVLVSSSSQSDRKTFEEVFSEKLPYYDYKGGYTEYKVDLSQFAGKQIYVALRHMVNDGMAAFFDDFYFEGFDEFTTGVSLAPQSRAESVRCYPNPTTDLLYIDGESVQAVYVYSLEGAPLIEQHNANQISLKTLPEGRYLVYVRLASGAVVSQIVEKR